MTRGVSQQPARPHAAAAGQPGGPAGTASRRSPAEYVPTVVHGRHGASDVFFVENRYSNLAVVGSGSYGIVCSAFDNSNQRAVAIKKVKNVMEDENDARRVLRELRILRHMKGMENTLKILDAYSYPPDTPEFDDIYIVMELMETDFDRVLRSSQHLSSEHTAYFLYQLLRAVAFMHRAHILHRDIKPSNLLVNANCDLVLCDFGLSRGVHQLSQPQPGGRHHDSDNSQEHEYEHLTEYVVTRWYRPPEILAESPFYGSSVDMWSVGCILGEMLDSSRKPIFRGTSPKNQMFLIIKALGQPTERELEFCTSDASCEGITRLCDQIRLENVKPWIWSERFPNANPLAVDLLSKLLRFDPRERITAEEALAHPFFACLHKTWGKPTKVRRFDYSFERVYNPDPTKRGSILRPQLRQLFLHEVSKYRRVWCSIAKPLHHKHREQPRMAKKGKTEVARMRMSSNALVKGEGEPPRTQSQDFRNPAEPEQHCFWTCPNCFTENCHSTCPTICSTCGKNMEGELALPTIKGRESVASTINRGKKPRACAGKQDVRLPRVRRTKVVVGTEQNDWSDGHFSAEGDPGTSNSKGSDKVKSLTKPPASKSSNDTIAKTGPRPFQKFVSNQATNTMSAIFPLLRRAHSAPHKRCMPLTVSRDSPFNIPSSCMSTSQTPVARSSGHLCQLPVMV